MAEQILSVLLNTLDPCSHPELSDIIMVNRRLWRQGTQMQLQTLEPYRQWEEMVTIVGDLGALLSDGDMDEVLYQVFRQRIPRHGNHGVSFSFARPVEIQDNGDIDLFSCSTLRKRQWNFGKCHGDVVTVHYCDFYEHASYVEVQQYEHGIPHGRKLSVKVLNNNTNEFRITCLDYDQGTEGYGAMLEATRETIPLWDDLYDTETIIYLIERYLDNSTRSIYNVFSDEGDALHTMPDAIHESMMQLL